MCLHSNSHGCLGSDLSGRCRDDKTPCLKLAYLQSNVQLGDTEP